MDACEQFVIDSCVATTHPGKPLNKAQNAAMKDLLERVVPDGDMWNSRWDGFWDTCSIGMAVELREAIRSVREDYGETGDDESTSERAVKIFRSVIEESLQRGPGFCCNKIRATDGREAWICFCVNDAAETTIEGVYSTPLAAEEDLRAQGLVFPSKHEKPPQVFKTTGRTSMCCTCCAEQSASGC